jgi:hypothetical protein
MDQVYSADGQSYLLSAKSHFRFWNFAAEHNGSINASNVDPAVPSPGIALQRAPYSSREGKVGEGGRDRGADSRFHPFLSFLHVWNVVEPDEQSVGQKLLMTVREIFLLWNTLRIFFTGFLLQASGPAITGSTAMFSGPGSCQQNHEVLQGHRGPFGLRSL